MVAAGPWDIMSSGLPAIVAPGGFPGQRNSAGCGRADSYCCQLCWVSSSNERTGRDGERFEPREGRSQFIDPRAAMQDRDRDACSVDRPIGYVSPPAASGVTGQDSGYSIHAREVSGRRYPSPLVPE